MWLLFAIIGNFFMALVNYSDEYLTHSSTIKQSKNIHERIGGVLLMSVLLTLIGAFISFLLAEIIFIPTQAILFALCASITITFLAAGYFYLLQIYSAHQVVPLVFGLSSIWLLGIEFMMGSLPDALSIVGIFILIVSSYLLDNGTLKWKTPTSLFKYSVLVSLFWALTGLLWAESFKFSDNNFAVYFWHLLGCFMLIFPLFIISPYRRGFMHRVKNEKKAFMIHSVINETFVQISFYFTMIAFSLAAYTSFVTAVSGFNSIFLLVLLFFFPIDERNYISKAQFLAIIGIVLGVGFLEW